MNHFLLRLLLQSLGSSLSGRRVETIRLLPPILTAELAGPDDVRFLVVVLSAPGPFCYVDSEDPAGGTGAAVFRRVHGYGIAGSPAVPDDRIVRLELSGGRDYTALVIHLFGSIARVRIEGRETIIESLDPRETGGALSQPRSTGKPIFATLGVSELARCLDSSGDGEVAILGLAAELVECYTGPDGDVDLEGLLAFRDSLHERGGPMVLGAHGRPGSAGPLPTAVCDPALTRPYSVLVGPFDDPQLACQALGRWMLSASRVDIVDRHSAPLRKRLAKRERLLATLKNNLTEAESSETWRNEANTLAAYQSRIPKGASEITLPDLYGSGETTIIKLDPEFSIADQIEKRFKKAAKLDRSREAIVRRIQSVTGDIEQLRLALAGLRDAPSLGDAIRRLGAAKRRHGITDRPRRPGGDAPESRQFRRFELDAGWFVLVGRNDRENDEITFRIAAPDDIWLHAQQTPGSHIVLRSSRAPGNPPDHILETAAGIAAHFSKARHASLVPVIYTRRKYVRKFKGAKPGEVVCEREKTIFAEPGLPAEKPNV